MAGLRDRHRTTPDMSLPDASTLNTCDLPDSLPPVFDERFATSKLEVAL